MTDHADKLAEADAREMFRVMRGIPDLEGYLKASHGMVPFDWTITAMIVAAYDARPQASRSEPHPGNEDGSFLPGSCARCGKFHSSAVCPQASGDLVEGIFHRVDQTTFYDPRIPTNGNCQQAVIASLIGLRLKDVPNFLDSSDDFTIAYRAFLKSKGYVVAQRSPRHKPNFPYIAYGRSPRNCSHACIYKAGELLHDPHPSRDGLTLIECIEIIYPKEIEEVALSRAPQPDTVTEEQAIAAGKAIRQFPWNDSHPVGGWDACGRAALTAALAVR